MTDNIDLEEIRTLIGQLPKAQCIKLDDAFTPFPFTESILKWLGRGQETNRPQCAHPRITLFAAHHGFTSNDGSKVEEYIADCKKEQTALARIAATNDADLRLYELDLNTPTSDASRETAMAEEDMTRAMAFGMMSVEPGIHLIATAGFGNGCEIAATALLRMLFKKEDVAIKYPQFQPEIDQLIDAVSTRTEDRDPIKLLQEIGGYEIAATIGLIIAARLAKVPVLLDGPAALAAACVLYQINSKSIHHCTLADPMSLPYGPAIANTCNMQTMGGFGIDNDNYGLGAALCLPVIKSYTALAGDKVKKEDLTCSASELHGSQLKEAG